MKTILCVAIAVLALMAGHCGALAMDSAAVGEVLKLKNAGMTDESIVAFVRGKDLRYDLSADDMILLKNQGLSSTVLAAMLSSGKQIAAAPTPPLAMASASVASPVPAAVPSTVLSPDAAYFYQQLSPYGRWILAEDNQWYWQPSVALTASAWRPYWDKGRWIYSDSGWYWSSDYPWGWAAFHYGRWRLHPLHGWMWMPDKVWAPAWVTWRSGGDYCGWAPLPPGTYFNPGGALIFNGKTVAIDFDFGLDWRHFSFCYLREMGEPLRVHFRREEEIRSVFYHTTVINHYSVSRTVVENQTQLKIVNHGVEANRVAVAKGRNIETVAIHDLHAPPPDRAHERFDKKTKTLEVYRPRWNDQARR